MSVLLNDNPVKKQELILKLATSGKSNKEIAEELGYKNVHNLYTFMRRRGLVWNTNKGLYVVKGAKEEPEEVVEEKPSGKVGSIISMFNKKIDGKEIAKSLRFSSYQEMADYMRSKDYLWDNKRGNYKKAAVQGEIEHIKVNNEPVKQSTQINNSNYLCNCMERFGDVLSLLESNKDKLTEILKSVESKASIPRYTLSGINIPKTISIANNLDRIVKEFSEENNISQKDMVEVALVEFLKKFGYESQVKASLKI